MTFINGLGEGVKQGTCVDLGLMFPKEGSGVLLFIRMNINIESVS